MKLSLGFSPCPNDTFIFDALVNGKIDTEGYEFETVLEDVETLNKWALTGRLALSKISYGVLPLLLDTYDLLDAGGALGKGVGPLLIARPGDKTPDPAQGRVAIPGRHTTAHLLFSLAYPEAHNKEFMVFSGIEEAVLNGRVDCGVIIHENRFTYQQKGLVKLMDLGNFWEQQTNCPIPLGGIVIRKDLGEDQAAKINALIRKSVEFAFGNYPDLPDYTRQHAQEMNENVMRQHIDLYVNDYSLSLGDDGKAAIRTLLDTYERIHA
ncbi:MAG: 1,4-dihydroxy-6-naphthoate synthase [Puia sp.]|nr:1,4-dihydroxy-6-naphthoate synthase [Puia sp.]